MTHHKHEHQRKRRWPEDIHMMVGVAVTVLLIASVIYVFGYVFPAQPLAQP